MHSSTLQSMIVVLLVSGCTAYAVWSLMPAALRRNAAAMLLRLQLPLALATRLRKHAQATSGCGCSGCDRAEKSAQKSTAKKPAAGTATVTTTHPITFHRRPRG